MNSVSRLAVLSLVGSAIILAGCTKKPVRPYPGETMIGQPAAGGENLNPTAVETGNPTGLQPRGEEAFDANGQLRGSLVGLDSIYFAFDKYNIKPGERAKAQAAKDYLDKNPGYRMLLEGYCDWHGTAEYNLGLGDRRANSVKHYLVTLGVGADKVDTLSKGSEEAVKNADEATAQKDRRVDFVILKGQSAAPAAGEPTPPPAP